MTSCEQPVSIPTPPSPARAFPRRTGLPGQVAAAIIGAQALVCAVFAVIFLLEAPEGATFGNASHWMFSVLTLAFAIGLGFVARGLWRGLGWPRTATVVWLVLLVPVGWAMVQAGRGAVGVLILGSAFLGIVAVAAESRGAGREP